MSTSSREALRKDLGIVVYGDSETGNFRLRRQLLNRVVSISVRSDSVEARSVSRSPCSLGTTEGVVEDTLLLLDREDLYDRLKLRSSCGATFGRIRFAHASFELAR